MKNSIRDIPKTEFTVRGGILVAVLIVNLLCQIFAAELSRIGFISWIFFLSNIMFFTIEEENLKKKFMMVLCGSIFGLLAAAGLVWANVMLTSLGADRVLAVMLPLTVILTLTILMNPICPWVCNNCAFAYFVVALIYPETAISHLPQNVLWAVIGHIVVNGICLLAVRMVTWPVHRVQGRETCTRQNDTEHK